MLQQLKEYLLDALKGEAPDSSYFSDEDLKAFHRPGQTAGMGRVLSQHRGMYGSKEIA